MKGILAILLTVLLATTLSACVKPQDNPPVECGAGYSMVNDVCVEDNQISECELGEILSNSNVCIDDPSVEYFDDVLYNLHYEGTDYEVYKLDELPNYGTDDVVELGVYNGYNYYFTSGTHYQYYKVVKDEIGPLELNAAIVDGWFSVEDVVTDFDITELAGIEIVVVNDCENPRETRVDDVCQLVIDEELLVEVQEIKEELIGDNLNIELFNPANSSVGGSGIFGQFLSAPRMNLKSSVPVFQGDQEWIQIQAMFYAMVEEAVQNGYQTGDFKNIKDFLNDPNVYYLEENLVFVLNANTVGETLFTRLFTYTDATLTEISYVITINARIINEVISLEHSMEYFTPEGNRYSTGLSVYDESKGLISIGFDAADVVHAMTYYVGINVRQGLNATMSATINPNGRFIEGVMFKALYYDTNNEVYLEVPKMFNNMRVYTPNNMLLETSPTEELRVYYRDVAWRFNRPAIYDYSLFYDILPAKIAVLNSVAAENVINDLPVVISASVLIDDVTITCQTLEGGNVNYKQCTALPTSPDEKTQMLSYLEQYNTLVAKTNKTVSDYIEIYDILTNDEKLGILWIVAPYLITIVDGENIVFNQEGFDNQAIVDGTMYMQFLILQWTYYGGYEAYDNAPDESVRYSVIFQDLQSDLFYFNDNLDLFLAAFDNPYHQLTYYEIKLLHPDQFYQD